MAGDFHLDEVAIDVLLGDPMGMVGDYLREESDIVAEMARVNAPVREGNAWSKRSSLDGPPGLLKASVHGKVGISREGRLYGSANAIADPAIFMEYPAVQLHYPRPFLTTALFSATAL
jgi:hypothetical protein